ARRRTTACCPRSGWWRCWRRRWAGAPGWSWCTATGPRSSCRRPRPRPWATRSSRCCAACCAGRGTWRPSGSLGSGRGRRGWRRGRPGRIPQCLYERGVPRGADPGGALR
ncbi:hypothetical protein TSOC_006158, partial [Tetrabaena socialis]